MVEAKLWFQKFFDGLLITEVFDECCTHLKIKPADILEHYKKQLKPIWVEQKYTTKYQKPSGTADGLLATFLKITR